MPPHCFSMAVLSCLFSWGVPYIIYKRISNDGHFGESMRQVTDQPLLFFILPNAATNLTQSLKNIIQYYNNLSFSVLLKKIRSRKRCLKFKRGGFKEGLGKKETNSNNQRKKWIQLKWERKTTVAKGEGRGWTITFFRNGITGEATQDGSWLSSDIPRQQCHSPLGTRISL